MRIYIMSLIVGIAVGVIYHLVNVRSPAPPYWALVGLLGMLMGEQLIPFVKQNVLNQPAQVEQSAEVQSDNSTSTDEHLNS